MKIQFDYGIPKVTQDFEGEFAEARALLHSADMLKRMASKIIQRKIKGRVARWIKEGNVSKLKELVKEIPDGSEKFYALCAVTQAESVLKAKENSI